METQKGEGQTSPFFFTMKLKITIDKDKLIHAFKAFPKESQKQFRVAMKEAAQLVAEEAKDNHKFKSRSMKVEDSIKHEVNTVATEATIYLDKNVAPHGIYLHEGTKSHEVRPKKYKALRWVNPSGRFSFSKGHKVKGIKPEPFLDNALNRKMQEITKIFTTSLTNLFKKVGLK